jgi:hypothetical protein
MHISPEPGGLQTNQKSTMTLSFPLSRVCRSQESGALQTLEDPFSSSRGQRPRAPEGYEQ